MKFEELVKFTLYKPATLARALLYGIGSKRLLAQVKDYEIIPSERKQIIQIAAGNKEIKARFDHSEQESEPASPQLDLIETVDSKPVDNVA